MGLQKIQPPALPVPPKEYDAQYLVQLTRAISIYFSQLASQAPTIANTANWSAVPTTADTTFPNLPFNDMYRGATEDILRIKVDGIPYAATATQAYVNAQLAAGLATKVSKAGDTMTGNLTVPSLTLGAWVIEPSGTKLLFKYSGNTLGSLDSTGNFTVTGNVTGFGTP
jgi:hypothetical protein